MHLVLNDFGKLGRSYLETDEEQADLETIIRNLIVGEYSRPKRVVAFNTAEGWARDVSEDIAWEVLKRAEQGRRCRMRRMTLLRSMPGSEPPCGPRT